jgi:Carboxypeptidase regulatory-like domain
MRRATKLLTVLVGVMMLPTMAYAQAGITGIVRDSSGGVLPGVTVEAASPALIEKVRTAVTDGQGRYSIVDVRPGVYTVTFTLAGFSTVRREGIQLPSTFTATVDAQLPVGASRRRSLSPETLRSSMCRPSLSRERSRRKFSRRFRPAVCRRATPCWCQG